ncbi:uncharacterized protein LOC117125037 [Anneissia japonica]|uniref:uncharacterized protein LOC117125037 n=1 Tax=Anneissia japonica TaxID=1529436 RepID=UPI001425AEBC|nr:uncharacterized protein LOC117125037 [Anneissia japonica]
MHLGCNNSADTKDNKVSVIPSLEKKRNKNSNMAVLGLLRGALKVSIGVGAIYVPAVEGVWSQSKQSSLALRRLTNSVVGQDTFFNQMLRRNRLSALLLEKWNSGVKWTFEGLGSTPEKVGKLSATAAQSLTSYLK